MPAEAIRWPQRALQIDAAALAQISQRGFAQGLIHGLHLKRVFGDGDHRQANATDADAVVDFSIGQNLFGVNGEAARGAERLNRNEAADFFNESGEHIYFLRLQGKFNIGRIWLGVKGDSNEKCSKIWQ
jgi:hypothetical protein